MLPTLEYSSKAIAGEPLKTKDADIQDRNTDIPDIMPLVAVH